jgi:ABC-type sugar transport system permease subunit
VKSVGLTRLRAREGRLFVLPWVIGFLLFVAWPLGYSLFLSFQKVSPAGFRTTYVGIRNYADAFVTDAKFGPYLLVSLRTVLLETPVILVFSLAVAVLLNRNLPARGVVRALFFLPVVIGSGYVIYELFQQGVGGLSVALGGAASQSGVLSLPTGGVAGGTRVGSTVNAARILRQFLGVGLAEGIDTLLNQVGLSLWRSGIQIILLLAGLQGISTSLYEAGRIDGANEWTLFWSVTFPILSPIMVAVVVFTVVDSFTDVFNDVLNYIRMQAFIKTNYGYASALSWIYFLVIFALLGAVLAWVQRRVFYRGNR